MSKGVITLCFIGVLFIHTGSALMCYKCNNVRHPELCGRHARKLTVGHVDHIEQCNGTCKIAAKRHKSESDNRVFDVYMRECDHNFHHTACNETENAKVCHCKDRDFCNFQMDDIPFHGEIKKSASTSLENSSGKLFGFHITVVTNSVSGLIAYVLFSST
ncbi:uncharacterized protein [Argopecten irradians]|uniref:uncharacterized protein n=1 Tax=Argopecten irradians TaxID=31199 RepID=UPI00371D169F